MIKNTWLTFLVVMLSDNTFPIENFADKHFYSIEKLSLAVRTEFLNFCVRDTERTRQI